MYKVAKIIGIVAVVVSTAALLWFMFWVRTDRARIGPAGPLILYFIWIPTLIFVVTSIILLLKDKSSTNEISQIILIVISVISLAFSLILFSSVGAEDRQRQRIEERNRQWFEENTRTTADRQYEYRLSLVGVLTDNPHAHVSVHNVAIGERFAISIDLQMEEFTEERMTSLPPGRLLMEMTPTDVEHIYIFTTTPYLKEEIEVFEINMETRTSRRIE